MINHWRNILGGIATSAIATLTLVGCGGANSSDAVGAYTPIPRPTAYARIPLYDTVMTQAPGLDSLPFPWLINAQATASFPDRSVSDDGATRWLNVEYPRYGVTIHCTFRRIDPAQLPAEISGRQERMSLNIGGNTTETTDVVSANGFHSQLLVTPQGTVTPVQFLSTDGREWVLSGTAFLKNAPRPNAYDSIAPIVNSLRSDLLRTLTAL